MKLWLKWILLVWLNAAFTFWVALGEYPQALDRFGIVCGVFTFVALYAMLDNYLLNTKKFQIRQAVLISVFVKSLFQLYPGIELAAGMVATAFVEWAIGKIAAVSAYFITLMDGLLLSLLVALITGLISFIMNKFPKLRIKSP
ncbi:MAG: hypothetical protein HOP02_02735 [Methylococcaceae bacterium]|nr:hypothetical protein [Methylococcaceae bacterium]